MSQNLPAPDVLILFSIDMTLDGNIYATIKRQVAGARRRSAPARPTTRPTTRTGRGSLISTIAKRELDARGYVSPAEKGEPRHDRPRAHCHGGEVGVAGMVDKTADVASSGRVDGGRESPLRPCESRT